MILYVYFFIAESGAGIFYILLEPPYYVGKDRVKLKSIKQATVTEGIEQQEKKELNEEMVEEVLRK
ncbi:hypothetical protein [Neobacillus niacini]|uniref:hypothetical protein n=1 Tax=Neobacillus niacini TaxID=86668 RepID=UPI00286B60FF|nr:hypothetical protein [Neobacillus niacini]